MSHNQVLLLTMMEGCSDSGVAQIPPSTSSVDPSPNAQMGDNNTSRKRGRRLGATDGDSLNMERDRRLKMTQMFNQLQATVPGVFAKATREVIINETIRYIKDLEKKKQSLEELKESMKPVEGSLMIPCANRNCSITVTVSSDVAFFGIQLMAQHGLITIIFKVFCKHQAEILAANVSVNQGKLILAITALVQNDDRNGTIEKIKREIMSL